MTATSDFSSKVERIRRHYDDGCFACGRSNPAGLMMDGFELEEGGVTACFEPRAPHRGTFGILHGGLSATALDEIMVWAGIATEGVLCVTAQLEIKYRHPLTLDHAVSARAVVEERRGRRLRCRGQLTVDGKTMVEGWGLYVAAHSVDELLGG
ncbi:MAG TPA: PaaI family thioesterase [Acidimicrobiia bacterium]|nr:PaaI family thioesterase [Acidimicrobiia bacterium]